MASPGFGINWVPSPTRRCRFWTGIHAYTNICGRRSKAAPRRGHRGVTKTFVESLKTLLWDSKIDELLGVLDPGTQAATPRPPNARPCEGLRGYLENHRSRMDYKKYRDQGLDIGSGAVEGVCKNLVQARGNAARRVGLITAVRPCSACVPATPITTNPPSWSRKPLLVWYEFPPILEALYPADCVDDRIYCPPLGIFLYWGGGPYSRGSK